MISKVFFTSLLAISVATVHGRALTQIIDATEPALSDDKPWFCHDADCPHFDLKDNKTDYELRQYEDSSWAAVNITSKRFEIAVTKGATALYRYFSGKNEGGTKIDMTVPVATVLAPNEDFTEVGEDFTVGFYLPEIYQKEPSEIPKPTADAVKVAQIPGTQKFVRSFSGFATQGEILSEALKLRTALLKDKQSFDDSVIFFASYDPVTRLKDRHNEVWLAKGDGARQEVMPLAQEVGPVAEGVLHRIRSIFGW